MSFFNFDGGDEGDDSDNDLDLDAYDDTGLLALLASNRRANGGGGGGRQSSSSSALFAVAATATACSVVDAVANTEAGSTEDVELEVESDWDNDIDWEDADQDDNDDDDDDASQHHFPTRGVMINIGKSVGKSNHPDDDNEGPEEKIGRGNDEDECDPSSSRKRKRSTIRVLRNVPRETQRMILSIRRTQLLCCVARSLQFSYATCWGSCISGDEFELYDDRLLLANVAYSLIPKEFHASPATKSKCDRASNFTIPSKNEVRRFSLWCFQFLNQCGERRRAALLRNIAHGAATSISTSTSRQRTRKLPRKNGTKQSRENEMKRTMQESSSSETLHSQNHPIVTGDRQAIMNPQADLLRKVLCLSPHYDEDPQLLLEDEGGVVDAIDAAERITDHDKSLLFLTMARYA